MNVKAQMTVLAALASALGALALSALFETWSWYPPALAVIAVVAGTGWICRRFTFPVALIPIVQGLALIVVTIWVFAHSHLWFGIVPTTQSVVDLQSLIHEGVVQMSAYAAPVPVTPGLTTITTLAVGLMALVVDCLAVTLAAPALAGLPLLALCMTTTTVLVTRTPWYTFIPCAVGWLLLMAANARTATLNWAGGTSANPGTTDTRNTRAALTLGVIAVVVGLILPVVIPGVSTPMNFPASWNVFGIGANSANGVGPAVAINPLVSLKRDFLDKGDRELLTVTSSGNTAPYLRMVGLDQFDGTSWTASEMAPTPNSELQAGQPVPLNRPTSIGDKSDVIGYTVRIDNLNDRYLPIPYPPKTQTIGAGWFVDPKTDTVFSQQFNSSNRTYTVTAAATERPAASMRALARSHIGSGENPDQPTPPSIPVSIAQTANSITADTDNPFDAAMALQTWFRSNFRYSTQVKSGNDSAYLQQFLNDRVGYCEQFAATMALMAQSLGIPARVVVGFAPGRATSQTATTTTWTVSSHDAHAWPELWMPGSGWTRFEPTPRTPGGATVAAFSAAPTTVRPTPSSSSIRRPVPSAQPQKPSDAQNDSTSTTPTSESILSARWLRLLAISILLAVVCFIPAFIRWQRRRRRLSAHTPALLAQGAWQELRDCVIDCGGSWNLAHTPRQAARHISSTFSLPRPAADAVGRILRATETSLYASPASSVVFDPEALRSDLRMIRQALAARATWSKRLSRQLRPRSVRLPWTRRHVSDVQEMIVQREFERV